MPKLKEVTLYTCEYNPKTKEAELKHVRINCLNENYIHGGNECWQGVDISLIELRLRINEINCEMKIMGRFMRSEIDYFNEHNAMAYRKETYALTKYDAITQFLNRQGKKVKEERDILEMGIQLRLKEC